MKTAPLCGVEVLWFEQGVVCYAARLTPVRFNKFQHYGYCFAKQQQINLSTWTDLATYLKESKNERLHQ